MKAMILAAGFGTRLRPITDTLPKALVNVDGMPLLEIVIRRLQRYGFDDILINVHHYAEQIFEFLQQKNNFGVHICISHEKKLLLETGGGLKNASWFFDDRRPFLLHNVDILSDLDLSALYQTHIRKQAFATLAVSKRDASRYLLFDHNDSLCGWKNIQTGEIKITRTSRSELISLAFSGIHVISPAIFDIMPEKNVFSIIEVYLQAAASENILAFRHDHNLWADLGTKEELFRADEILKKIRNLT